MFNVTTVLPHNLLQTNPCIRNNFSTQVFRKRAAQLHYVGPELRYISWPPKEAKRWSHWICSSLGTIFQPMRSNSVPGVKCSCKNKNVWCVQSMVWHFVRHSVYLSSAVKGFLVCPTLSIVIRPSTPVVRQPVARDTVLGCPRRLMKWKCVFCPFLWKGEINEGAI